ncbi:uncharacterized protein DS421_14g449580 [Arachis hypogaea]|nr:uncharacterized protein DS421_14g449580 [Arachis hypogaea]
MLALLTALMKRKPGIRSLLSKEQGQVHVQPWWQGSSPSLRWPPQVRRRRDSRRFCPRNVTFYELMKKLHGMIEGGESMVLKYQLVPEDLDTLVSVRNDEDLKHMIDEHDRHEVGGAPMLRTFMCPLKPLLVVDKDNQGTSGTEPYPLEQRYIDAINGFQRISPRSRPSPIRAAFNAPSACSSPKSNSPDGHTTDLVHESPPFHGHILGLGRRSTMHRVHSSPSISSLSNLHSLAFQQHEHHNHYHNHSPSHQSPCQSQNQGQSQGQGQARTKVTILLLICLLLIKEPGHKIN